MKRTVTSYGPKTPPCRFGRKLHGSPNKTAPPAFWHFIHIISTKGQTYTNLRSGRELAACQAGWEVGQSIGPTDWLELVVTVAVVITDIVQVDGIGLVSEKEKEMWTVDDTTKRKHFLVKRPPHIYKILVSWPYSSWQKWAKTWPREKELKQNNYGLGANWLLHYANRKLWQMLLHHAKTTFSTLAVTCQIQNDG